MLRARNTSGPPRDQALHDELVALREENARLREERFRPLAPTSVPARLREVMTAVDHDAGDALVAAWLEVEVLREGLLRAMTDLRSMVGIVEVQLRDLVPVAEIDRRTNSDRRRGSVEAGAVSA